MSEKLTAAEEAVMRHTFERAMLRAAEILDGITEGDVLDAQAELLSQGLALEKVAKIDRALLGSAHFRAIVKSGESARVTARELTQAAKERKG